MEWGQCLCVLISFMSVWGIFHSELEFPQKPLLHLMPLRKHLVSEEFLDSSDRPPGDIIYTSQLRLAWKGEKYLKILNVEKQQ